MPVNITYDKYPAIQSLQRDNNEFIRCRTPENLLEFLAGHGRDGVVFSAHPVAGEPESFRYDPGDGIVTRKKDGRSFEIDQFLCYAFQCDVEGYSHTEYVDIGTSGYEYGDGSL
jgi:hypothetical protein